MFEVICQACGGAGESEVFIGDVYDGRYDLLRCHACGGLGMVHGYDPFLGEPVYIKVKPSDNRRRVPAAIEMALKAVKEIENATHATQGKSRRPPASKTVGKRNRLHKAGG